MSFIGNAGLEQLWPDVPPVSTPRCSPKEGDSDIHTCKNCNSLPHHIKQTPRFQERVVALRPGLVSVLLAAGGGMETRSH